MIRRVYGDNAMYLVHEYLSGYFRFKTGTESFEDVKRSARPRKSRNEEFVDRMQALLVCL